MPWRRSVPEHRTIGLSSGACPTAIAVLAIWWRAFFEFSGSRDVTGAGAVGEQAVVADAVEARWQHVAQKAANELVGREPHHLVSIGACTGLGRHVAYTIVTNCLGGRVNLEPDEGTKIRIILSRMAPKAMPPS